MVEMKGRSAASAAPGRLAVKALSAVGMFLLFILMMASTSRPALAADWMLYTAQDSSFSVGLPVKPEVNSDNGSLQVVSSPSENETYIVEVTYFPGPREYMADKLFTAVENSFATGSKSAVEAKNRHQVLGHPATDFKLRTKEGYHAWERVVVIGDRAYQMLHISVTDDPQPERFWNSFALRP